MLSANGTDYVTALYSDILNRAPDQAGLHTYNSLLQGGTSPASVAKAIWDSPEHRGIQVDGFYQTFLHRLPEPESRQNWIDNMVGGMSEETVMLDFVTSSEFTVYYLIHPPEFDNWFINRDVWTADDVAALYHDILGRRPDSDGLGRWVLMIDANDPTWYSVNYNDVARIFINSHERHLHLVDSYYANFLERVPDSLGESAFTQELDQGVVSEGFLAVSFLSSQEFINRHPLMLIS